MHNKMKYLTLTGLLLLAGATSLHAEDFNFTPASLAAGSTVEVELNLNCEADKWGGFQFDLHLPEGVSILEDEEGFYCTQSDRLSWTSRGKTYYFGIDVGLLDDGSYRFLIDNSGGKTISGTSGALMRMTLVCDPTVATGEYYIGITGQKLSNVDGSEGNVPSDNSRAGTLTVRMDTEVGASGYATFSWPLELDFTDMEVEAYIAANYSDGWLQFQRVQKVPAGTGLLLHGEPGMYHPTTSKVEGVTDDVTSNLFIGTSDESFITPEGSNYYALAQKENSIGFYHIKAGVCVPRFKAYFELPQTSDVRSFIGISDISTGLYQVDAKKVPNWFDLGGRKLGSDPTDSTNEKPVSGIYVTKGHKTLIK